LEHSIDIIQITRDWSIIIAIGIGFKLNIPPETPGEWMACNWKGIAQGYYLLEKKSK
jgi:hypothetical protein